MDGGPGEKGDGRSSERGACAGLIMGFHRRPNRQRWFARTLPKVPLSVYTEL
jgi:hypothetical protein